MSNQQGGSNFVLKRQQSLSSGYTYIYTFDCKCHKHLSKLDKWNCFNKKKCKKEMTVGMFQMIFFFAIILIRLKSLKSFVIWQTDLTFQRKKQFIFYNYENCTSGAEIWCKGHRRAYICRTVAPGLQNSDGRPGGPWNFFRPGNTEQQLRSAEITSIKGTE